MVKDETEYIEFIKLERKITSVTYDINWKKLNKKIKLYLNITLVYLKLDKIWLLYSNWFNESFNKNEVLK